MGEFFRLKKKVSRNEELVNPSRRAFVAGAAAAVVGGLGARFVSDSESSREPEDIPHESAPQENEVPVSKTEVTPVVIESKDFSKWLERFKSYWTIANDKIQFARKEDDSLVGPEVAFKTVEVEREKGGVMKKFAVTPGQFDKKHLLPKGLAGEWTAVMAGEVVALDYGIGRRIPADLDTDAMRADELYPIADIHDIETIRRLWKKSEPDLVRKIEHHEITTMVEVVAYFGNKPVAGVLGYTLASYIHDAVVFTHKHLSSVAQDELRSLLVSLCAKESFLRDGSTSDANAVGLIQMKPSTWKALMGSEYGTHQSVPKQVEAIGKQFDQIYSELMDDGGDSAFDVVRCMFVDVTSFEKHFLVPCMINAYNVGATRMREIVKSFLVFAETSTKYLSPNVTVNGKDLFKEVITYAPTCDAQFGSDSAGYTGYIYALQQVGRDRDGDTLEMASL